MSERVLFLGLDIGTTTTSALLASARIFSQGVSGKKVWGEFRIEQSPPPVFTPFSGEELNVPAVFAEVDRWLKDWGVSPSSLGSTGAIVTGMAAETANAQKLLTQLEVIFTESVMAATRDPRLESWVSYQGAAQALSLQHPEKYFLNFDIGGGTTNLALGKNGKILGTASYFIGARHFEYQPGSYQLRKQSSFGEKWAARAKTSEPRRLAEEMVRALTELTQARDAAWLKDWEQAAWSAFPLPSDSEIIFTFSGGVGELIYASSDLAELVEANPFGDLGPALALAIRQSPELARNLVDYIPFNRGRATVLGMALQQSRLAGATVYRSEGIRLPLRDIPVFSSPEEAAVSATGARAFWLRELEPKWAALQKQSDILAPRLNRSEPTILLLEADCGKALGQALAKRLGAASPLLILDELDYVNAQFLTVGKTWEGSFPVSFYGMQG